MFRKGDLVITDEGYPALVLHANDIEVDLLQGNGLLGILPPERLLKVPLRISDKGARALLELIMMTGHKDPSTANFAEVIMLPSGRDRLPAVQGFIPIHPSRNPFEAPLDEDET